MIRKESQFKSICVSDPMEKELGEDCHHYAIAILSCETDVLHITTLYAVTKLGLVCHTISYLRDINHQAATSGGNLAYV